MEDEIKIQTPIYELDIWYEKGRLGASGIIDGVFRNALLDEIFDEEEHKRIKDEMTNLINSNILMGVPTKPMVRDEIDPTLLDRLIERLKKEVHFAKEEDYIVWALWIAHTWLVDLKYDTNERIEYLFGTNVYLCVRAPIGHGKSVALNTLRRYSRKGLKCDKLTAPVAFRLADLYGPTLVLDEFQSTMASDKALEDFVITGFDHDKQYARAQTEGKGIFVYNASLPIAFSMRTSRSKDDTITRYLEFIMNKAPNTFRPALVRSTFTQELYELRVWAQQPGNLAKLIQIKDGLEQILFSSGTYHREQDLSHGLCVIARLFGKDDWIPFILKKIGDSLKSLQENLSTSIEGFLLDSIDILTHCKPFESNYPVYLSEMRDLALNNSQELNADDFTIQKIRSDKGFITRAVKNQGFITKENRNGTKRDYRIDFSEKASRDAYNKLRKDVRGESEPLVQSKLEVAVNRPSEFYGLTDEEFAELEDMLTEAKVSDDGVRDRFPKIELHKLVNDGIVKIDDKWIVHLKQNRPKGNVLELTDLM